MTTVLILDEESPHIFYSCLVQPQFGCFLLYLGQTAYPGDPCVKSCSQCRVKQAICVIQLQLCTQPRMVLHVELLVVPAIQHFARLKMQL
ncbi:hypothetical protein J6590_026237 [Homalodisca vitripennis]|nr:hypothetical protein J6590_026237 [Homalodisca vitripennis]